METGNVIVIAICILILAIFLMGFVEMAVPFFKKAELNRIGSQYISLMEVSTAGGLTIDEKSELENELIRLGFENVSIVCTNAGSVKFGEVASLDIDTTYDMLTFGDLTSFSQTLNINFYDDFKHKRIEE